MFYLYSFDMGGVVMLSRFFDAELDPDVAAIIDNLKNGARVLEHGDCSADRSVFVDGLLVNVEAARALGIRSLLFTDAEKLKKDLAGCA